MQRRGFLHGAMAASAVSPYAQPGQDAATDGFRRAILQADPRLSKFNPLPRILCHDDFDDGISGWCELVSNHDGNLDTLRPVMKDLRPPQLSNCTFFDIGTHGSVDGAYALKLATRPRPFHTAVAIKRLTYAKPGLVQFEMYFTFKAEQVFDGSRGRRAFDGNLSPSELNFGDFTIGNDICEGENGARYHCTLRYQNTDAGGAPVQKWMYATSVETTTKMDRQGQGQSQDFHVRSPGDWKEIPGGHQPLCFNETATKINWHYFRWVFDTARRRNTELQVNELTLDLRDIPVPAYDHPYRALNHLLNFLIDVRTHAPVRNFFFVDSVVISVDW
jgi:hypothetical protein